MSSKIIALVGVAASAAFVYYCIEIKKNEILDKCHISEKIVKMIGQTVEMTDEKIEEVREEEILEPTGLKSDESKMQTFFMKSDPAFGIAMGDVLNIVGMFSPEEKRDRLTAYIDELCKEKECLTDVRYSEDIKNVTWDDTMIDMINFFREEHIRGASLYINSNIIHIEGEIVSEEAKKHLDALIAKLSAEGLHVENDTTDLISQSSDKIVEEIEKKIDNVQTLVEKQKKPQQVKTTADEKSRQKYDIKKVAAESLSEKTESKEVLPPKEVEKASETAIVNSINRVGNSDLQTRINRLLQQEKIVFDDRMNRIADRSRKSMDELAALLQGRGPVHISVYAHASDDRMVNTIIAQKRAEIVKNYLRKKGVKVAVANGTGVAEGADRIEIKISE